MVSCTKPIIQSGGGGRGLGKPEKKGRIGEGEWVRYCRGTSGDSSGLQERMEPVQITSIYSQRVAEGRIQRCAEREYVQVSVWGSEFNPF